MENLLNFLKFELGGLFGAFVLIITYQIVTGKIHLSGLLEDSDTGQFSITRLQVLVVWFISLFPLMSSIFGAHHDQTAISDTLLALLMGGSNTVYLTAKAVPLLPSIGKGFGINHGK